MAPRSKPAGLLGCVLMILYVTLWSCQANAEAINAAGKQQQQDTSTSNPDVQLQESPYSDSRRAYEPDGSYRREEDRYARDNYPPPGYDSRQQQLYGRYEDAYGPRASMPEQPKYDDAYAGYRSGHNRGMYAYKHEPVQNTYMFRSVPATETATIGVMTAGGPALIAYTAKLACASPNSPPGGVGTIFGSGTMATITDTQAQMTFTMTFDADAGTVCGVDLPGLTLTANGLVNIEVTSAPPTITQLQADVLPITGIYVPNRTNNPAQVKDYSGGSLMLRTALNGPGTSMFTVTLLQR